METIKMWVSSWNNICANRQQSVLLLLLSYYYWSLDSKQNVHSIQTNATVRVKQYKYKRKYSQAASNTFLMHHSLKTCWKYTFHTFRTLINTIGRQASQRLPLYKMVSWFRGQVMYNFNCLLSHERSHLFLFSE